MGLGIGIDCEICGEQLRYGDDTEEIVHHVELTDSFEQIIKDRPVKCHACRVVLLKAAALLNGSY